MGKETDHGLKIRSWEITEGPQRAPARSMLRAMGLGDEDLARPFVGVANSWSEVTPCQLNLGGVAKRVKEGVHAAGGTPRETWIPFSIPPPGARSPFVPGPTWSTRCWRWCPFMRESLTRRSLPPIP